MLLTRGIIDEIKSIFVSRSIQRVGETESHIEYFFNESLDESLEEKFRDTGMEVDDYYYRWLAFCMDDYASKLKDYVGKPLEDIPFDEINDSILSDLEPDVYTHDLLQWLSSNLNRMGYVDEVLADEFEYFNKDNKNLCYLMMVGQLREMSEVYGIGFQFVQWFLETKND
ncbi:hypothetical protein [Methanosarcina sp. UBA5]|uniref:hypothetical protein n=1 Tax=Methanosarcina sp. UBA5 TaxID=1915593 RepID=UPI0025F94761|nr:hypothetical protein [Methanosarcina sp. UBA5]